MANRTYLAMTAAEFAAAVPLPTHPAWMACHFSPYGSGLTNLPASLPPESLIILNDRIPIFKHDPDLIAAQLQKAAEATRCDGILLDFQSPDCPELKRLTTHLVSVLSVPLCVSETYARELDCPVFLSPCPHHIHLEQHCKPWQNQDIWLDLARNAETVLLTDTGSSIKPLSLESIPSTGHSADDLHCHYSVSSADNSVCFTLWRTAEDQKQLSKKAETLGIRRFVSLLRESE